MLVREEAAAADDDEVNAKEGEGKVRIDETETATALAFRKGWRRISTSCSLTEEALLVTLAVSIALATDAALVAGMMLEVDTPGVGMLRETPTAPQTCSAKARVTGKGHRQ